MISLPIGLYLFLYILSALELKVSRRHAGCWKVSAAEIWEGYGEASEGKKACDGLGCRQRELWRRGVRLWPMIRQETLFGIMASSCTILRQCMPYQWIPLWRAAAVLWRLFSVRQCLSSLPRRRRYTVGPEKPPGVATWSSPPVQSSLVQSSLCIGSLTESGKNSIVLYLKNRNFKSSLHVQPIPLPDARSDVTWQSATACPPTDHIYLTCSICVTRIW